MHRQRELHPQGEDVRRLLRLQGRVRREGLQVRGEAGLRSTGVPLRQQGKVYCQVPGKGEKRKREIISSSSVSQPL